MQKKIRQNIRAYTKENIYDFDNNIILHHYPQMIFKRLGTEFPKNMSLLELGLGHGYSALEFKGKFDRHTILEGDDAVIEKFNIEHKEHNIRIIHTFFEDYDADEKYDLIIMGFILEHVEDPVFILEKYKDYLAENGKLFVAVPNAEALNRRLGHECGLLPDMTQLSKADYDLGHKRYFTVKSIIDTCRDANLKVDAVEGIYLKPFTTKQILSLNLDESVIRAMCTVGQGYPELSTGILVECIV